MNLTAIVFAPGGLISLIAVGLIAGCLTGKLMRSCGDTIVGDVILALDGALVVGLVAGIFMHGVAGGWGGVVVAFLGASAMVAVVRAMPGKRSAV
jgi:uncharacterized membrane protein YeaQ/YmgE (transglycosylase-associated protein family)